MILEEEFWKDIPEYEGLYQVSNLGRVRSLDRYVNSGGGIRLQKGIIRKEQTTPEGYKKVGLSKNGEDVKFSTHQLVAMAFLSHKVDGLNKVIDHINRNPSDNTIENIRIVTQRENNSNKDKTKTSSKYVGVYLNSNGLWTAGISLEGKNYNLSSRITSEEEAREIYLKALKGIDKFEGCIKEFRKIIGIEPKNITMYFDKSRNKFVSEINISGIKIYLKRFESKEDAISLYFIALYNKNCFYGNVEDFRKLVLDKFFATKEK